MAHGLGQLNSLPAGLDGRGDALRTLQRVHAQISAIKADEYVTLKMTGFATQAIFEQPVEEAIQRLSGKGILDIPHDIRKIRRTVEVANPDMTVAQAIPVVEEDVQTAVVAIRQMQETGAGLRAPAPARRPWLLSAWSVVGIFIIALLYAIAYFVFKGSQVHDPLSAGGPIKVLEAGRLNLAAMKTVVTQADNLVDASRKLLEHLTKLISKVPALIAGFGIAYAAVRKLLT